MAATTLSIVAVFVPIAFMGGLAGQWFKPFALTMASSVLVSLFISFSLDPMLSAHWPDPHVPEHRKAWITRQLDRFNRWFDRLADRLVADDGALDIDRPEFPADPPRAEAGHVGHQRMRARRGAAH